MKSCQNIKCEGYGMEVGNSAMFCERCGKTIAGPPQDSMQSNAAQPAGKLLTLSIHRKNQYIGSALKLKVFLNNSDGFVFVKPGETINFNNLSPGEHHVRITAWGCPGIAFSINLKKDTLLYLKVPLIGPFNVDFGGAEYLIRKY